MATKKAKEPMDLSGTSRFISEPERKFLFVYINDRATAEAGLDYFSKALSDARKDLWNALYEFHPDLKDYHANYNSLTGQVEIIKKKLED